MSSKVTEQKIIFDYTAKIINLIKLNADIELCYFGKPSAPDLLMDEGMAHCLLLCIDCAAR